MNPSEICDTEQSQVKKQVAITVSVAVNGLSSITSCPNCGYRYFDADVLETMENRMKSTPTDARSVTAWAISL